MKNDLALNLYSAFPTSFQTLLNKGLKFIEAMPWFFKLGISQDLVLFYVKFNIMKHAVDLEAGKRDL